MRARSQGPTSERLNHLTLQASETKRWLSIEWCFHVRISTTRTTRHGAGKKSHIEKINDSRVMSDKAKHFVMLDDPEFLFQEMDSFLAAQKKKS